MKALLPTLLLCTCFSAQGQYETRPSAPRQDQPAPDQLDIQPPPGWEGGWKAVVDNQGHDSRYWMFLPAKAAEGSLARTVSISSVWGAKHGGSQHLMEQWNEQLRKTCPQVTIVTSPVTRANGYSVAYARFHCPKRSDTGEGSVDLAKTIASEGGAYLVVVAQRTAAYTSPKPGDVRYAAQADADALSRWMKSTGEYLQKTVRACYMQGQSPAVVVCSN